MSQAETSFIDPAEAVTSPEFFESQGRWPGVARGVGAALAGAVIGFGIAENTPAHLEMANTPVTVKAPLGQNYNEIDIRGDVKVRLPLKGGQITGGTVRFDVDAQSFVDDKGQLNLNLLPAYISLFSDKQSVIDNVSWAVLKHDLVGASVGLEAGLMLLLLPAAYRNSRRRYDQKHGIGEAERQAANDYYQTEKLWAKRVALGTAAATTLGIVPVTALAQSDHSIKASPEVNNTFLAGGEISGPLSPLVLGAIDLLQTYLKDNNDFYNGVDTNLAQFLKDNPLVAPNNPDIVPVGFITDAHCNVGMSRVIIDSLKKLGVKTLASAGDNNLNADLAINPGCTNDLAMRAKKAHIAALTINGNHDGRLDANNERKQGFVILNDQIVSIDGLTLYGEDDPRISKFNQPIQIRATGQAASGELQRAAVLAQGKRVGQLACAKRVNMVVILHDPAAGQAAIENGCGFVTLALTGHTHQQSGPTDIPSLSGFEGQLFTGASAGGAGTAEQKSSLPLGDRTFGPLQYLAHWYVLYINKNSGKLAGLIEFRADPSQQVNAAQTIYEPSSFRTASGKLVKVLPSRPAPAPTR